MEPQGIRVSTLSVVVGDGGCNGTDLQTNGILFDCLRRTGSACHGRINVKY